MTYNFDPDKWLDIQMELLKKKLQEEVISREEYDIGVKELEERYHQMWKHLDGYFQINDD